MRKRYLLFVLAPLLMLGTSLLLARAASPGKATAAVPVHMVVTAESQRGDDEPALVAREDVKVYQGRDRDEVTNLIPLRDEHAARGS